MKEKCSGKKHGWWLPKRATISSIKAVGFLSLNSGTLSNRAARSCWEKSKVLSYYLLILPDLSFSGVFWKINKKTPVFLFLCKEATK